MKAHWQTSPISLRWLRTTPADALTTASRTQRIPKNRQMANPKSLMLIPLPAVRFNIQRGIITAIFGSVPVGDSRSFENLGKFVFFRVTQMVFSW